MAHNTTREVAEGLQYQGEDEAISYTIDTTNWGGSPTTPSVIVKDASADYADVTSTVIPSGSPTVDTNTITLPLIQNLTIAHMYRVEVKFTRSGNTEECFFRILAER